MSLLSLSQVHPVILVSLVGESSSVLMTITAILPLFCFRKRQPTLKNICESSGFVTLAAAKKRNQDQNCEIFVELNLLKLCTQEKVGNNTFSLTSVAGVGGR
jgi:hypothetical protein